MSKKTHEADFYRLLAFINCLAGVAGLAVLLFALENLGINTPTIALSIESALGLTGSLLAVELAQKVDRLGDADKFSQLLTAELCKLGVTEAEIAAIRRQAQLSNDN